MWAARHHAIGALVDAAPRLGALVERPSPPVETLPPFNERVTSSLRAAHEQRRYRAELVWMHFLRHVGFRPYFFRFCHVARYRLGAAALTVRRVRLGSFMPPERERAVRALLWRRTQQPVVGVALHQC